MHILVSNDDGIHSKGIQVLFRALEKIPKAQVTIVAPDREQSATSHALTLQRPLRISRHKKNQYTVDGTPTDSVMLGVHQVLKKKPDLLVSGINKGANLGEDVHYSGTVAAAMEGAIMGIPSIAVSLIGFEKYHFEGAANFTKKIAQKVLKEGLPKGVALNINVPNIPEEDLNGYEMTKLGKHSYGDIIIEKMDPRGRHYYWIGGDPNRFEKIKSSDCSAYLAGKISVTPIKVDLTDYSFLRKMKTWKLN